MLTFEKALRYPEELNATHYCGYGDWRLPTTEELVLTMRGAISRHAPFDQECLALWTSDRTTRGQKIWYHTGQLRLEMRDSTAYVRAVRSIPEAPGWVAAPFPFGHPEVLRFP